MIIEKVSPEYWADFSETAHLIAFSKHKPQAWDRIDFALLAIDESKDVPAGYITCREWDAKTLYWQFGGAFPETKGTVKSWKAYKQLALWSRARYSRIVTHIENDNSVMLKMAMRVGFLVVGIRNYERSILLEHVLETPEVN